MLGQMACDGTQDFITSECVTKIKYETRMG